MNGLTLELETNSRYSAILELAKHMDKLKIPYVLRPCYDGWELLYPTIADVLIDAVSHLMVNESRNLIEVMGPGEYHPTVYPGLTAAQAIEHFYVHYRMNHRTVNKLLLPPNAKAEFYDVERQEYVTREQLYKEYEESEKAEERGLTFGQYIRNCLTVYNGTLVYA